MGVVELSGMYIPTAKGNAETPASSMDTAMSAPRITSPQARVPPRMPSAIEANSCGCGAVTGW